MMRGNFGGRVRRFFTGVGDRVDDRARKRVIELQDRVIDRVGDRVWVDILDREREAVMR
jgi:hypothetical protein